MEKLHLKADKLLGWNIIISRDKKSTYSLI